VVRSPRFRNDPAPSPAQDPEAKTFQTRVDNEGVGAAVRVPVSPCPAVRKLILCLRLYELRTTITWAMIERAQHDTRETKIHTLSEIETNSCGQKIRRWPRQRDRNVLPRSDLLAHDVGPEPGQANALNPDPERYCHQHVGRLVKHQRHDREH